MNVTQSIRKFRSILILPITIVAFLILEIVAGGIIQESIAEWRLQNLLQKRGVSAEAVVTRLDVPSKGSSTIQYRFVAASSQESGEEYTGYADIPGSEVDRFQPGMKTVIIYDPENPERSRLKDPPQTYSFVFNLLVVIAAFIGAIAVVGAGICLLLMPGRWASPPIERTRT